MHNIKFFIQFLVILTISIVINKQHLIYKKIITTYFIIGLPRFNDVHQVFSTSWNNPSVDEPPLSFHKFSSDLDLLPPGELPEIVVSGAQESLKENELKVSRSKSLDSESNSSRDSDDAGVVEEDNKYEDIKEVML